MAERLVLATMSTNKIKIAVAGENRLATAISSLFQSIPQVDLVDFKQIIEQKDNADVIFETENINIKKKQTELHKIEEVTSSNTLILTSILGVTATEAASWLFDSFRVVGFAFFANIQKGDLIEIAPALQTDPSFVDQAIDCLRPVTEKIEVVQDEVGLVYPRILAMIINEAVFALMEKTATINDIDIAMKMGTNYPYGPFEWADEIGLDDIYAVLSGLQRSLGEERYRPASLLKKMVIAKWLGKGSERGFHFNSKKEIMS